MSKFYVDNNGVTSTILENFDSADRRFFHVRGVFLNFLKASPLVAIRMSLYAGRRSNRFYEGR